MLLFSLSPGHILQEFTLTCQWLWPGSLVSQAGTRKFWSASSRTWTGPSKLSSVANANKSQLRPDPVWLKACHRQTQLWACLDTAKRQVIILSYHGWYCCCHGKENWKHLTTHFSKQTEKIKVPVCILSVCISLGLTVADDYKLMLLEVTMYSDHKWYAKNGSHKLMGFFLSVVHI